MSIGISIWGYGGSTHCLYGVCTPPPFSTILRPETCYEDQDEVTRPSRKQKRCTLAPIRAGGTIKSCCTAPQSLPDVRCKQVVDDSAAAIAKAVPPWIGLQTASLPKVWHLSMYLSCGIGKLIAHFARVDACFAMG